MDATTLEANAALRSIVRRDSGASYDEYLNGDGIQTMTKTICVLISSEDYY